jgi:hypothetical protein
MAPTFPASRGTTLLIDIILMSTLPHPRIVAVSPAIYPAPSPAPHPHSPLWSLAHCWPSVHCRGAHTVLLSQHILQHCKSFKKINQIRLLPILKPSNSFSF